MFRYNNDADIACTGLLSNLKLFTTRLFSSISLIIVLIWNSWQLSIIAIFVLLGALYPLTKVRKRIQKIMDKTVFSGARVMTHYNEAFAANRVISSFNLYKSQDRLFSETLKSVFKLGMDMVKKNSNFNTFNAFCYFAWNCRCNMDGELFDCIKSIDCRWFRLFHNGTTNVVSSN